MSTKTVKEKKEIVQRINELRKDGMTAQEAIDQAGISSISYYNWRRSRFFQKKEPKRAYTQRKQPKQKTGSSMITLNLPAESEMPLMIVMGKSSDVKAALGYLSALKN